MPDTRQDRKAMLLMALIALWLAAWGYSLVFLLNTDPDSVGVTRGLNRMSGFLGWQGVAGMIAFACFAVGRSFPKWSGIRRISAVPFGMALALVLVVAAFALLA